VVAAVAIVGILSVLGVALYAITRDDGPPNDPVAGPTGSRPPASPGGPGTADPTPGPSRSADPRGGLAVGSGPVRVDVYVDYQCPPCGTFEERSGAVLNTYLSTDEVTLRIHPVAFIDDRSRNEYATRAAAAMACAHEAGGTLEFHTYLLEHQPAEDTFGPTDEDLVTAGRSLGLDQGFADCVTGQRRVLWAAQATTAAQSRGVKSVPAVYVNDREVDADRAALVAAVDAAR
jgi:protein-disulfide isomerase